MASADPLKDGSKRFKLVGGPADKMKVRLYPFNDGWKEVLIQGNLYVAPAEQRKGTPIMEWQGQ